MAVGQGSHAILRSSTIVENISPQGSAVYLLGGGSLEIINTIVRSSGSTQDFYSFNLDALNSLAISYSNIEGGQNSINMNSNGTLEWLDGNIDIDPLFTNTDTYDLDWISPCINTGSPEPPFDPDGSISDMGYSFYDMTGFGPSEADFEVINAAGIAPHSITIVDLSTNSPGYWKWNLGDGKIGRAHV